MCGTGNYIQYLLINYNGKELEIEYIYIYMYVCMYVYGSSAGKESACSVGDPGLILGLGRSPGEGTGYPL